MQLVVLTLGLLFCNNPRVSTTYCIALKGLYLKLHIMISCGTPCTLTKVPIRQLDTSVRKKLWAVEHFSNTFFLKIRRGVHTKHCSFKWQTNEIWIMI